MTQRPQNTTSLVAESPRALVATGVTAGYRKGVAALRDIDARFEPGNVTAILGPNGAGKSTLLRVLLGVKRPWAGAVTLGAEQVRSMKPVRRAQRIAFVAQRPRVALAFTVREVVALAHVRQRASGAAVDTAITCMELSDLADTPFAALSVGQRQRVALARSLAQLGVASAMTSSDSSSVAPCALLADEPAASMDPRWALQTFMLMRDLARQGAIVVCAMHDLTLASRFADDAILLDEAGAVALAGACDAVIASDHLERVFQTRFARLHKDGVHAIAPIERESLPHGADCID